MQVEDETALGRLMRDFWCTEAKDMHYRVLADRVHHFKNEEEGIRTMCRAMEEMCNEVDRARRILTARKMLADHKLSHEDIAGYCELTLEEVQELAAKQPA